MWRNWIPGGLGVGSSVGTSLCCLTPMALMSLGLGGGTLTALMAPLSPVLYPMGLLGVAASWWLYWRRQRACRRQGCRMAGRGLTLTLLVASTLLLGAVSYVQFLWEGI